MKETKSKRPFRAKIDFSERLTLGNKKGNIGAQKIPCDERPDDPDCIVIPPPTTIFLSSEGVSPYSGSGNPAGDIMDLKIAWANNYAPDAYPMPGYTSIRTNLNRGAGGATMYLTFTRDPGSVKLGDSQDRTDRVVNGAVRFMQTFSAPYGDFISNFPPPGYLPIQRPGSWIDSWNTPDLNDGAGGDYIYGFMVKDPQFGPPIEVGVLASNNSNAQPPVGWYLIDGQDLNRGAGGDYIYLCAKDR